MKTQMTWPKPVCFVGLTLHHIAAVALFLCAAVSFSHSAEAFDVTIDAPDTTNSSPYTATFTFSEPVFNELENGESVDPLTESSTEKLQVTNGTIASITETVDNQTYSVEITPTADGAVTVDLPAGLLVADDPSMSGNNFATATTIFDSVAPTLSEVTPVPTPGSITKPTYTFSSTEVGAITYGGGCTSATTDAAVGDNTIAFNTLADGTYNDCTIQVTDAAGNPSSLLNVTEFVIDTSVTALDVTPPIAVAQDITVELDATGNASWTAADIDNGSSDADGGVTLSLDITSATALGPVTVTLTVTDDVGLTATDTATVTVVDTTPPTVVIDVPTDANGSYVAFIEFSEPVTGFSADDVDVGNGSAGNPSPEGSSGYFVDITPTANGPVTVDVPAGAAQDGAGNDNTAALTATTNYDNGAPTVTVPANITIAATSASGAVVTFTLTDATDVVDGPITPTADPASGSTFAIGTTTVTVSATDSDGNTGTATFDVTVIEDATAPTVSIDAPGTANGPYTATITFSEPVTGLEESEIVVGNGSVDTGSLTDTDGGTTYTVDITPDSDGAVTVDVAANVAQDSVGNDNTAATQATTIVGAQTKTTQTIQRFLFRRADLLLNHGPDGGRQIDRLLNRGGNSANSTGTGFAASTGSNRLPATTAFKNDASGLAGGVPGINATGSSGGLWAFDAPSGLGAQDWQGGNSGGAISTLPFGFSVTGERGRSFSFATSFVQVAKAAAEAKQRKLGGGAEQLAALGINAGHLISPKQSDLDIWAEGQFTYFEDGTAGSETSGHFGVLYLGVDYVLTPNLLVGALVQIDSMEQSSTADSTKVDGIGWLAGPYLTARLSDNVFFQGRAAWGQSTNDISPFLTYTDEFDTERWLATGTLKGRWKHGAWLISPAASVGYVEERQESYTDSVGTFIPEQTVSIGQAKFGPEISYRGEIVNGVVVRPFASLEGIWTFSADGADDLVVDTLAGNNELRGKVGVGVKALTAAGTALTISGSYDGLGDDDFQAVSGELRLAIPLQ